MTKMRCNVATIAIAAMTSSVSAASSSSIGQRNAFMNEMKVHGDRRAAVAKDQTPTAKTLAEEMSGRSKRARKLREKVLAKAKYIAPPTTTTSSNVARRLQDDAVVADGTDDAFAFSAAGQWEGTFQFDATQYSLSYHRCAAVKQFDDTLAATEDSTTVFTTKNFAVFRFCPSSTCEGTIQEEEVVLTEEEMAAMEEEEQVVEGYTYVTDMFDRLQKGGANGKGCSSNYGEYVVELSDYMSLMTEYHAERFEAYCADCESCMYDVYLNWMKNGYNNGSGRNLKERTDKSFMDELESDEFKNAHRELGNYNKYDACPEYDTCHIYKNICEAGLDETFTQYFECTQIERGDGKIVYVAPHCASNGVNVTLGLYSDEYCSEYIGSDTTNYLGYKIDADALAPYVTGSLIDVIPVESMQSQKEAYDMIASYDTEFVGGLAPDSMCIPCHASKQAFQQRVTETATATNAYAEEYAEEEAYEVSEICTNLYALSARCDKHYRKYSSTVATSSTYKQANLEEEMACGFIDSIAMGNYDENGYVMMGNVSSATNFFTNNVVWEQYGHNVTDVSHGQIIGLCLAVGACALLAMWAGSLHKSLNKGTSWRPRKALNLSRGEDAVTVQRRVSYLEPEDLNARQGSYYMS